MKHQAQIQREFIKQAQWWRNLSPALQLKYLRRHPKSKKYKMIKRIKYKGQTFFSADTVLNLAEKLAQRIMGGPGPDMLEGPLTTDNPAYNMRFSSKR